VNEMTVKDLEKRQKEFEKRLEFLEIQTAENISNLDKIYKGLEQLQKRMELLSPKGIIDPVDKFPENPLEGYRIGSSP